MSPLRILIFCVITCFFSDLFAQKIEVRDEQTLEPLPFAHVQCTDGTEGGYTDVKGAINISNFNCDSLRISFLGYGDRTIPSPKKDRIIYLSSGDLDFEEVVVSASHWEEDRSTVSNHILKIKSKELRNFNPQTSGDILANSGGLYVQKSQQGGGSPMIRGFSANRILISVDGIRMNNAIFRSGNLQNIISLDPSFIREGEVLFGPGTVLYGSDAIGGVIDFHLLQAPFNDSAYTKGQVTLGGATANCYGNLNAQLQLGNKRWSAAIAFSTRQYGDVRMGKNGPDEYLRTELVSRIEGRDTVLKNENPRIQTPSGYQQYSAFAKIRYKLKEGELFSTTIWSTTGDIPRYDRYIQRSSGTLRYARWDYGPQLWFSQTLGLKLNKRTRLYDQSETQLNFQRYEESRISRSLGSSEEKHQIEKPLQLSLNQRFEKSISSRTQLFYGMEANWNQVESEAYEMNLGTQTRSPILSRYPASSSMDLYGIYSAVKHRLNKIHHLNAGLRYSIVQTRAKGFQISLPTGDAYQSLLQALNGSLGMTSNWNEQWRTFFNLGSGFRAPNIDDLGKVFDSEPGSVTIPNTQLRPEQAASAEWGIRFQKKNRFFIDAGTYYTRLFNALVRRPFELNGQDSMIYQGEPSSINAIQNAANAQVYGAWIEARWRRSRIELGGTFNYQFGQEEDDEGNTGPLRHAGPPNMRLFASYRVKKFRAIVDFRYAAEVSYKDLAFSERNKPHLYLTDEQGNPYSPSWNTLNAYAEYALTSKMQVSAGLENILNNRYRPYSSGIVAPGINATFQATLRF